MAVSIHLIAIMLIVCPVFSRNCNCKRTECKGWNCTTRNSPRRGTQVQRPATTSGVMSVEHKHQLTKTYLATAMPPAVTGFTATRVSCTIVLLMWTYSIQHNMSFVILEQKDSGVWKTVALDWKTTSFQYIMTAAGVYSFRVKACQENTCSQYNSITVSYLQTGSSLVPAVSLSQLTVLDSNHIVLQWSYPVADSTFLIEGRSSASQNEWLPEAQTSNTSVELARELDLKQYRVSATSWCGQSQPAVFPQLSDNTLDPVSNVTVMRLFPCSHSVKIGWIYRNVARLENVMFHVEILQPRSEWETVAEGLTATSLLYNLTEDGEYRFKVDVQGVNGVVSEPLIVTKNFSNTVPTVKDLELEFKSTDQVRVSWRVELGESTDVMVELSYRNYDSNPWILLHRRDISKPQDVRYDVQMVSAYGYQYRVIANSSCGDSNEVLSKYFYAGYSIPHGPPLQFSAANIAQGVVKLQWETPGRDIFSLYNYFVRYNTSSSNTKQINVHVQHKFTVDGLANFTWYTFSVRAQLSGFNSVWTSVSIKTLPGEIPKPYRLSTTSRGLTWLGLQWGILGDDVADGYVVCYRLAPSNAEETLPHCLSVSNNAHSANITGLNPCTVYLINVTCTSKQFKDVFQPSQILSFQTLQTAPTILVQLNCSAAGPTSLHLRWTERDPASCPAERYRIRYKSDDNTKPLWAQNTTGTKGYLMTDLRPWTTYDVSVTPWNQGGRGFKSNVVDCKTEQGVPSVAPVIIKIMPSSVNITVVWNAIEESKTNGIIEGYRLMAVSYALLQSVSKSVTTNNTSPFTFTFTFTQLHPFTEFNISVAAYTEKGDGPASYTIVTTQQAAPREPRDVFVSGILARSVYVHWKPPLLEDQNGIITAYIITTVSVGEQAIEHPDIRKTITPAFIRTILLAGLTPYTHYYIYVRASTMAGIGRPCQEITCTTKQDSPSCPESVEATVISSTAVLLEWHEPLEPNGLLTGYNATLTSASGKIQTLKYTSTTTRETIYGLLPNMNYTVRVNAENVAGRSTKCSDTNFHTFPIRSEPPGNFSATALGQSTIVVNWTKPRSLYGQLAGYRVVYRVDGYNDSNSFVGVAAESTSVTIRGLSPRTTFNITVFVIAEDSTSGHVTEGLPAPYQLVTTAGPKRNIEAPGENELHWWIWVASGCAVIVSFIVALCIVWQRLRRLKSATDAASGQQVQHPQSNSRQLEPQSDQTQYEALPMSDVHRYGSFEIVPIEDILESESETSSSQESSERVEEEQTLSSGRGTDCDPNSDHSEQLQPRPIIVRVQLHTFVDENGGSRDCESSPK